MRPYLLFVILGLTFLACSTPPPEAPTTEADEAAIHELLEQRTVAFNAGDLDGYIACFADNAVWMLPNQKPITTTEKARTWYGAVFGRTSFDVTASTRQLTVFGDWAYARTINRGDAVRKETGDLVGLGSSRISILQRQLDGGWKIAQDIWNTDFPPPEPETEPGS